MPDSHRRWLSRFRGDRLTIQQVAAEAGASPEYVRAAVDRILRAEGQPNTHTIEAQRQRAPQSLPDWLQPKQTQIETK